MNSVLMHPLDAAEAGLWWLGQAGYVVRAGDATVAIDPYLTDSAAANAPEFTRPEQAAEFAAALRPRFVLPNHYDLMALNAENPETFRWFCGQRGLGGRCVIARRMEPFVWS
jgi:L-ascorbate metabolism protein UlaG (beta-lactamase superfamily)